MNVLDTKTRAQILTILVYYAPAATQIPPPVATSNSST
jgi:hypothetical protein